MCDRGSNFQKAFNGFNPLFCFGHRLNNILKRTFFQNQMKTKKSITDHNLDGPNDVFAPSTKQNSFDTNSQEEIFTDESDSSSDDDYDLAAAIPVTRRKKSYNKPPSKTAHEHLNLQSMHLKMTVDKVPLPVKHVLRTLQQCKKIVKHVKKVSEKILSVQIVNTFLFSS
jgi:hypothetical protein